MARRVYLHIGLPKTGTTFLQTRMWHNRGLLRTRGLLYPGAERLDHYQASRQLRRVPVARMGEHAGAWDRLVAEVKAWDGDALISHEFICMAEAKHARRAVAELAPAEVRVIMTVRDYVLQFPAMWQEALKMNSMLSFDEFMADALARKLTGGWSWDSQNIPAILRRWATAVPASDITVITVPPTSGGETLWHRWLEVLGIEEQGFELDLAFSNTSVGAAQAALLHRIKPYLSGPLEEGPVRHRWVRGYLGHDVLVPQRGERFGVRPEHVAALRKRSQAAVDAIESGGFTVVGDPQELMTATPASGPHPDDIADSEIVDVAARAIEQMLRDLRRVTLERDEWRARAEESLWKKAGRRFGRREDPTPDEGYED